MRGGTKLNQVRGIVLKPDTILRFSRGASLSLYRTAIGFIHFRRFIHSEIPERHEKAQFTPQDLEELTQYSGVRTWFDLLKAFNEHSWQLAYFLWLVLIIVICKLYINKWQAAADFLYSSTVKDLKISHPKVRKIRKFKKIYIFENLMFCSMVKSPQILIRIQIWQKCILIVKRNFIWMNILFYIQFFVKACHQGHGRMHLLQLDRFGTGAWSKLIKISYR